MNPFLLEGLNIDETIIEQNAKHKEYLYRLIFDGRMSKEEVWKMDFYELKEANFALDNYIEKINKSMKK